MWYEQYCKEHKIPIKYGKERLWHEQQLRRHMNRASQLESEDISGLSKEEAKHKLEARGEEMVAGMSGISLLLMKAIIGWLIGKLLDRTFGNQK